MNVACMSSSITDERDKKPTLVVIDFVNKQTKGVRETTGVEERDYPISGAGMFNSFEDIVRICGGNTEKAKQILEALEASERTGIRESDLNRKKQEQSQNITYGDRTN